jgi:hypothetical protein
MGANLPFIALVGEICGIVCLQRVRAVSSTGGLR